MGHRKDEALAGISHQKQTELQIRSMRGVTWFHRLKITTTEMKLPELWMRQSDVDYQICPEITGYERH